jgi:hypothetical protein
MSTIALDRPVEQQRTTSAALRSDPAFQAFWIMRIAFTVAPILFGLDKFWDLMVPWQQYLAGWVNSIIPGSAVDAMHMVGVVEIAAGLLVLVKPRIGAYVVAAWLGGIIINLLSLGNYWDIALRDFGLLLGALTLARLSAVYDKA